MALKYKTYQFNIEDILSTPLFAKLLSEVENYIGHDDYDWYKFEEVLKILGYNFNITYLKDCPSWKTIEIFEEDMAIIKLKHEI